MSTRYKETISLIPFVKFEFFYALREKFKEGYSASDLKSDVMAGIVVGMVAIPLGMALAIASGVPPQNGLYTVILGGAIVALLGGSRCQVSGPTAAFVVILVPIAQKFGLGGLLVAGFLAGVLLVGMGAARLGRMIEFIPHPVTTGFTAGIAVVIATIQLKDFFGLDLLHPPERFWRKIVALVEAAPSMSPIELAVGSATLFFLLWIPKVTKRVPAPLIALLIVTVGASCVRHFFPHLEIATIGTRFTSIMNGSEIRGIPPYLPGFTPPWTIPGPHGEFFTLNFATVEQLLPSAFAIAMLGAIESLLSAVVADGMTRTKHDPNAELVALGIGNMICPLFGGIAATGAIARTATNIRYGAKSPIAAIVHSIFALLVVLTLASQMSHLPMAALAALLLLVAYNMSDIKHFFHVLRVSPRGDALVLLLCFFLTVFFDMVVGVAFGVMFAALLFMRRMAALTTGRFLMGEGVKMMDPNLPSGVFVYQIAGPLFFGATNRAVGAMGQVSANVRCVIFDMSAVPAMDASGLVALESAILALKARNAKAILAEVQSQPSELLKRANIDKKAQVVKTLKEGLELAKQLPTE